MTFYQSEANMTNMGPNFFEMELDKVIGLAYWGLIDYLGESQGWPAKGWAQGVFDIALQPKPKAWLMRSFFKPDEPTVHIAIIDNKAEAIMWNGINTANDGMSDHFNRKPGSQLSLITYTNADEVELLLNGKSLGRKQNPKDNPKLRNQIRWDGITYAEGRLEAVAYNKVQHSKPIVQSSKFKTQSSKFKAQSQEVARHKIETTGKAVRLIATPEDASWQADGTDLMHVRIEAVDGKGRRVPMAQDELKFEVEGDARIVAVSSGDHNSDELNVTDHRRLYNGSALVILRAGKTPSTVSLKTSSAAFKTVTTRLLLKKPGM